MSVNNSTALNRVFNDTGNMPKYLTPDSSKTNPGVVDLK